MDRLAGHPGQRRRTHRRRGSAAVPRAAVGRRRLDVLRGFLERHPVAAVPRRHRQADLPPRVVGPLRRGEPALRRGHLAGRRARARPSGFRTTSCSWCPRCCGCCVPTSPSDSFCTFRSHRSSCSCRCRGGRRSSKACSAPTWSASICRAAPRTSCSWPDGWWAPTRHARRSVSVPVSAKSRSVSAQSKWARFPSPSTRGHSTAKARDRRIRQRAREIRRELGNPRKILLGVDRLDYTKGIDVRLNAFSELLDEGRVKARGHRACAVGHAEPRTRRQLQGDARGHRAAGRPHQRRIR